MPDSEAIPRRPRFSYFIDALCLAVSSLSVGWLVGLSLSPVVQTVVASILTFVLSGLGVLAGLGRPDGVSTHDAGPWEGSRETPSSSQRIRARRAVTLARGINVRPIAVLLLGLAIGASFGIYVRTNELLGPAPVRFAKRWTGIGLTDDQIRRRLFDLLYPTSSGIVMPLSPTSTNEKPTEKAETAPRGPGAALTAGLYSVPAEACQLVAARHGEELRTRLAANFGDNVQLALTKCKSDECAEAIKVALCR